MVCYQKDYITIYVEPEKSLIQLEWHAFANSEQYQEALNMALQLVRQYDLTKCIANARHMKAIRQQDQHWTITHWFPLLAKTRLRKIATIVSDDIFNQMAISNIMSKAKSVIMFEHRYFTNLFSALDWLAQD